MKKIYALLAAGIVTASAVAAPALPEKAMLTERGKQVLSERVTKLMSNPDAIPMSNVLGTRSFEYQNVIYTSRIVADYENPWKDNLAFEVDGEIVEGRDLPFSFFPFYNVTILLTGYSKVNGELLTYLPYMVVWPSHYWYDQIWVEGNGQNLPEDQRNLDIVSLYELSNGAALENGGFCNVFREGEVIGDGGFNPNPWMNNDGIEAWYIMPTSVCETAGGVYYQVDGFQAHSYQDASNVTTLTFNNFVAETEELSARFVCPLQYTTSNGATRKKNLNVPFNGVMRYDFESRQFDQNATDIHIFNTGTVNSNNFDQVVGVENPYTEEFGDVERLFIYAPLNDLMTVNYPADLKQFDSSKVGCMFKTTVPAEQQVNPENMSFMEGALYSKVGFKMSEPQNWVVESPEYKWNAGWQIPDLMTVPKAGAAIPAYSVNAYDDKGEMVSPPKSDYDQIDGMRIYLQGYSEVPVAGCIIETGTDAGFKVWGDDLFNNKLNIQYVGKIKYHGDPANAAAYEEFDAIGEGAGVDDVFVGEDSTISVENGVLVINATADVTVYVYTIDGVAVKAINVAKGEKASVELGNGLYVVKAGNDVKKVIL